MSFHLNMLHGRLPAWEYQSVPTRADWCVFYTLLSVIVMASAFTVIGYLRWLA